ncbi:MAG: 50S ribosomal protein L16 [Candidatus Bathyarchaeota archaeon]|nr:MAG: 50S ribosomal protein L16 [Candidatus Bathyarchaeota archaeon]
MRARALHEENSLKAKNYREVKGQPYTRKEYAKSSPPSKIVKFTMGDPKSEFPIKAKLISLENAQVRHNALEAARIASNRHLSLKLGENYYLRIMPYPHMILRENKMIFGAHADRLQDGMRGAFGKPIGTAARVKTNQPIIVVGVDEDSIEVAKQALKRSKAKLPMPCRIAIEKTRVGPGD